MPKSKIAGYPVITPFVVTNFAEYKDIITADGKTINGGDNLITAAV